MMTLRMAKWTSFLAVLGFFCAACSGGAALKGGQERPEQTQEQAVIKNIDVGGEEETVSVAVETSRAVAYTLYQKEDPLRLVLELPGTSAGDRAAPIQVNRGTVTVIDPVTTDQGNSHIEFHLSSPSRYDIDAKGAAVLLTIAPDMEAETPADLGEPAAAVEEAVSFAPEPVESRPLAMEEPPAPSAPAPPEPVMTAMADDAAQEGSAASYVTGIDVRKDTGGTLATIRGDGSLRYEYFLVEGRSLVIDVFDAGNKIWPTVHKVDDSYIEQIRIGEHFQPDKKVRVVFDLKTPGDYQVRKGPASIKVAFGSPDEEPAAPAAAPSAAAPAAEPAAAAAPASAGSSPVNVVSEVYFKPLKERSRIEIKTTGKPEFKVVDSDDPQRLIVDISNARIEPGAQKTLDLSRLEKAVTKITAFQYKKDESPVVRVVAQLRSAMPYRVTSNGNTVAVDISSQDAPAASMAPAAAPAPAPAPAPMAAAEPEPAPAAPAAEEAAPAAQPSGPKVYLGKKVSLDFVDADVNDILRLVADVSGLNFVAGPEVKGKVTIRLADVPWDQALDIILKTNVPPLAQIHESDTIIRITTLAKIQDEEELKRRAAEQKIKNQEAQKKLEPLVTRRFSISYADIADIEKVARQFTSDRVDLDGLLTTDERTNTIIVRDLQENVDEIARTIEALDAPTPAVVVEARIVEVTSTAAEQLGVQWGLNFAADPAHGNALPFEFPNSVGVTGGVAGEDGNFMVNLPAASPAGGIGLSFGHIANTLSLDLRLQALEQLNEVRILSNPRVLVVQNQEATINLGQQLPIPATDAEGNRTVTFQDVGIKLVVTPQVTNDDRVFMDINVEKSSRGENVPTTEGTMFSINSRRAQTQVLILNGETAVIGGLTIEEQSDVDTAVPGFSKIPGLGWLFKSKDKQTRRDEMMIFLTPRIIDVI